MPTNVSDCCAHCGDEVKSRRREFSEQAYSALLVWGEIQSAVVDQAICDSCYIELRDVLIDRADDIGSAASQYSAESSKVATGHEIAGKAAATKVESSPRSKVRKAG